MILINRAKLGKANHEGGKHHRQESLKRMFVLARKRTGNSGRIKIVLCKDRGFSNLRGLANEILPQMKREFGKDSVL